MWFLKEKEELRHRGWRLGFENLAVSNLPEFMKESGTDLVSLALRLRAS